MRCRGSMRLRRGSGAKRAVPAVVFTDHNALDGAGSGVFVRVLAPDGSFVNPQPVQVNREFPFTLDLRH